MPSVAWAYPQRRAGGRLGERPTISAPSARNHALRSRGKARLAPGFCLRRRRRVMPSSAARRRNAAALRLADGARSSTAVSTDVLIVDRLFGAAARLGADRQQVVRIVRGGARRMCGEGMREGKSRVTPICSSDASAFRSAPVTAVAWFGRCRSGRAVGNRGGADLCAPDP